MRGVVRVKQLDPMLVLSPTATMVKNALKSVLYDAMVVISAPPRLLSHPDLAPYVSAASEDAADLTGECGGRRRGRCGARRCGAGAWACGMHDCYDHRACCLLAGGAISGKAAQGADDADLTEAVTNHLSYKRASAEMQQGLDDAFAEVNKFTRVFLPFASTFFTNEGEADTMQVRYSGATDLATFQKAIALYKGQVDEFETIPTFADIGIVRVDSVELKLRVMPSPARCLYAIRDLLPLLMAKLTADLVSQVRVMYSVLASNPPEVDQFVLKVREQRVTIARLQC